MKHKYSLTLGALVAAIAAFAGAAAMQPQHDPKPSAPPPSKPSDQKPGAKPNHDMQDMDAMMKQAQPGPEHAMLAKYIGEWTTSSKFTGGGQPDQPPVSGTAKITSDIGGRFFNLEETGSMMGMPFQARHYTGYNNATKRYEAAWSYTHSTAMMTMTGTSTDGGKTINWTAAVDNAHGDKEVMKITTRYIDDDHFTIELRGQSTEGAPESVMSTEYTRKK